MRPVFVVLPACVALALVVSFRHPELGATVRPNVVVVYMDDDTSSRLSMLNGPPGGPKIAATFRAHGIRSANFVHSYVTTPVCTPSRASYFTGQYAHHTGIHFNTVSSPTALDGGAEGFTQRGLDQSTLATWLHDAGYRTIHVGKYLNNYPMVTQRPPGFVPPGWDDWHVYYNLGSMSGYWNFRLSDNGPLQWYLRAGDANYATDVDVAHALQAIAATPASQPFVLHFATVAPHATAIPAPRHANLRPSLRAPRPPTNPAYQESDVSDKNAYVRARPLPAPASEVEEEDQLYRNGANTLAAVAEGVVSIVDALAIAGRLNDTIFVFTNDNGWSFFDHRVRGKHYPYEAASRVYLVVSSANPSWVAAGRRTELVGNIDLAPTFAELCGATIPAGQLVDGTSFAPILRSTSSPPTRTDLLLENFGPEPVVDPTYPNDFPAWQALVTGPGNAFPNWKYVEFLDGQRELYDLTNDPFELQSVVDAPANASLVSALAARLHEIRGQ